MPQFDKDCISLLAEDLGLELSSAHGLYDEIMAYAKRILVEEGQEVTEAGLHDEAVRLLSDKAKKRLAEKMVSGRQAHYHRRVAEMARTHEKAQYAFAHVLSHHFWATRLQRVRQNVGFLSGFGRVDPVSALKSLILGSQSGLPGSRTSVSVARGGIEKTLTAPLLKAFNQMPHVRQLHSYSYLPWNKSLQKEIRKFSVEVIDVIKGGDLERINLKDTNLSDAQKLAYWLTHSLNESVRMLNDHGSHIKFRKNYAPTATDVHKVMQAEMDEFVEHMLPRLNWERSFLDMNERSQIAIDGPGVNENRRRVLREVYKNITKRAEDNAKKREGNPFRMRGIVTEKFSHTMQFEFKDGAAWMDYHERFGRASNIIDVTLSVLQERTRMISLMEMFGPDPELGLLLTARRLAQEVRTDRIKLKPDVKTKVLGQLDSIEIEDGMRTIPGFDLKRGLGVDVLSTNARAAHKAIGTAFNPQDGGLSMAFAEAAGETLSPVHRTPAKIASTIRVAKMMAILGKATITAILDVPNMLFHMNNWGMGWDDAAKTYARESKAHFALKNTVIGRTVESWGTGYDRFGPYRDLAPSFYAYFDDLLADFHSRFTLDEPGTLAKLTSTYFRMNFLSQWTDAQRGTMARTLMSWLGEHSSKPYNNLPPRLKYTLEVHGIGPDKWNLFRKLGFEMNGRTYLDPELVNILSHDDLRTVIGQHSLLPEGFPAEIAEVYKRQTEQWLKDPEAFRRQLKNDFYSMMTDQVRYGVIEADDRIRYFTLRGTSPGTWTGEMLRFTAMLKTYPLGLAERVWAKKMYAHTPHSTNMDLAKWIAFSTTTGYVSLALSDLASGYWPRDISGEHGYETFLAAVQKSGAGAIYGDTLFRMVKGYEPTLVNRVASMVFGPSYDTATDAMDLIWEGMKMGDRQSIKAYKLIMSNTPFANLWYSRMALDAAVLHHFEDYINPGSVERRQEWNRQQLGREAIAPYGG